MLGHRTDLSMRRIATICGGGDKDHAGDPMSFVPIFHSESIWIEIFQQREERHLKKRNESSKQCDENHHASNLTLIILDEHKNPHSNIFDKHGSVVSPEG
jgi:hypothetical protein